MSVQINCLLVHRQKREQIAAHPRAMMSFKIAEFENFMIWKQFTDVAENFRKRIAQIFWSITHTRAIKVRAQLLKFIDIWVFKAFFCQFWMWMINVIIILDAQMVSSKICPNLTKNWNLPKISRLISQSLGRPIKSHIVQNIYHMLVFTRPKGLLIRWPNKKVSRFVGLFHRVGWCNKSLILPLVANKIWHFLSFGTSNKPKIRVMILWIEERQHFEMFTFCAKNFGLQLKSSKTCVHTTLLMHFLLNGHKATTCWHKRSAA